MAKKSKSSESEHNIDVPPISKSAAGAATGAVLGAVGGPVGAAVGGLIGAVVGKRAESGKPIIAPVKRAARQAVRGTKALAKTARVALPAAKRVVKSVRPGKANRSGTRKSATRKSRPAKTQRTKSNSRGSKRTKANTRAKSRTSDRRTRQAARRKTKR